MTKKILTMIAIIMFSMVSAASAVHITLATSITNADVLDFSEFDGDWIYGSGPTQVGSPNGDNILFSSSTTNTVLGNKGYGLSNNGSWNSSMNGYVGLNANSGHMDFTFANAISAVGGFINHTPSSCTISALDAFGNILEYVHLYISTSGYNQGEFHGFLRDQPDIFGFRLSSNYVVLDNLTYSGNGGPAPVPKPATMLLLGCGILGLAGYKKYKKA